MIENKRFTFDIDQENGYGEEPYFCDGTDSFYVNNADEMELFIKKMNELNNENKSFKAEIEQLKKCYNNVLNEMDTLAEVNDKTYKENKELKEELRIYRQVANCHNCVYLDYNWFDDGDEFEICKKGNNEQQMYYHICKDWREL